MKRSKKNEEGKRLLACRFCGAPQRVIIPLGTMQVNCEYCGGVILIPPWMGGKTLRCGNHPERLAVGICNDCGTNFCAECLRVYHLRTRDAEATLYLDSVCLRKRYAEKTSKIIWSGILVLAFGLFLSIASVAAGILCIIFAGGTIAYGFFKSRETPTESTVDKILIEREQIDAESVDAEKLYNQLLTHYVNQWGALTGTEFLREEIRGYLSQGVSFPEAVKRIRARVR